MSEEAVQNMGVEQTTLEARADEQIAGTEVTLEQPAVEPTQAKADNGKATRLEQEIASYKRVMEVMGIDPDSDVAQRVMSGVVSKEDLMRQIGAQQPAQQPQEAPGARERLRQLVDRVNSDEPTQDDFKESLRIIADLVEEGSRTAEQQKAQTTLQSCAQAVTDVLRQDPVHTQMPEQLRTAEEQMFLAATDFLVGAEARKTGNPQAFLNPRVYGFYASKAAEQLGGLREYYMSQGRQATRTAPKPTSVNPIPPSTGGQPVQGPPPELITVKNMRQAAAQYLQGFRGQV